MNKKSSEVAELAKSFNCPVLFLDTCIFLDIIRPITIQKVKSNVNAAIELIKLASTSPPECMLIAPSVTSEEWNKNLDFVYTQEVKAIKKINLINKLIEETLLSLNLVKGKNPKVYNHNYIVEELKKLSQKLLNVCYHLTPSNKCTIRAGKRVLQAKPPAKKAKNSFADCVIFEEVLEVCAELTNRGFDKVRIFVSSNTKEYCKPGSGLVPALKSEFENANLIYTDNLGWALSLLNN
ncbi:PIN domain-containing protein [Desulfofundulus thermosubterraneus]|uniref:DUF4935 domain-containing protein n=1 Tax=Desulfofundulus thermosubterraneus DSM 16057 TaxID=1121432 RepID=A0A1M6J8W4_9FIRM|nr:PIN domain-containing protein [Desulfofundulus thermosubterraneus]SHJ43090.1 hypothetical protein SAMN02745219_02534 [Desulfofundulus thermosubterraneus DSM 16057]